MERRRQYLFICAKIQSMRQTLVHDQRLSNDIFANGVEILFLEWIWSLLAIIKAFVQNKDSNELIRTKSMFGIHLYILFNNVHQQNFRDLLSTSLDIYSSSIQSFVTFVILLSPVIAAIQFIVFERWDWVYVDLRRHFEYYAASKCSCSNSSA